MNLLSTGSTNDAISTILQNSTKKMNLAAQKISTGLRINSASDDAANLSLSQSIQLHKNTYDNYSRNAQMEKSMLQVAESDLSIISNNNQRIRDLALQASNGTYGTKEREMIQLEINQLAEENTRIVNSSSFNGNNLLDGSSADLEILVSETGGVTVAAFQDTSNATLGLDSFDISSPENASILIEKIDAANTEITSRRANLGALMNEIDSSIDRNQASSINLASSLSTLRDTDIAIEMTNLITAQILTEIGVTMQTQANNMNKTVLNLLRTTETK